MPTKFIATASMIIISVAIIAATVWAQTPSRLPPHVDLSPADITPDDSIKDIAKVRMWGWSKNGLVAYSIETYSDAIPGYGINFVIVNIVTDKEVYSYFTNVDDTDPNDTFEKAYGVSEIRDAMSKHSIIEQQAVFSRLPLKRGGDVYNVKILQDNTKVGSFAEKAGCRFNVRNYSVVVDINGERSKTIKTVNGACDLGGLFVSGYFLSPYENRALFVIAEIWLTDFETYGRVDSHIRYKFSGGHLSTGFR